MPAPCEATAVKQPPFWCVHLPSWRFSSIVNPRTRRASRKGRQSGVSDERASPVRCSAEPFPQRGFPQGRAVSRLKATAVKWHGGLLTQHSALGTHDSSSPSDSESG
ncbi:hypothetical protein [Nostoc sp. 106C]|uniref:hypothetical protein n=1 Tax=Nostoc sp. 106C TaxID=1932667 RepID=UPI00106552B7|nr:hypothetical protein [Nostoc sp. 106C]